MQEIICQAHMAGQMDAGCKEPSWSNALAYYLKNVEALKPTHNSRRLNMEKNVVKASLGTRLRSTLGEGTP